MTSWVGTRCPWRAANHRGMQLLLALCSVGSGCSSGSSHASAAAHAPQFTLAGPSVWSINGPQGGPFSNTDAVFVLANPGEVPVEWSASSIPEFVKLDQLGGSIAPSTQTDVHADLLEQVALSLEPGLSTGTLAFHNDSAEQPDAAVPCSLTIDAPIYSSELVPAGDFASSGPPGGPFQPPATVYSLSNTGTVSLHWQANTADAWVNVTPQAGQLAPGASVDLSVAIAAAATGSLPVGLHSSSLHVVNTSTSATIHARDVSLNVLGTTMHDGWTIFTPSPDTRTVYVSSSQGNDSNNGLSPASAKRTIGAGKALLRNGFPDWLLLCAGDSFDEAFGAWGLSGRSASERLLLSSYGAGPRPLLRTGTATGIFTANGCNPNYVAIVGLHFFAHTYAGGPENPRAIAWFGGTQDFLLEDCFIEKYETNVVVQGFPDALRHSNVAIRRNVIVDAFNTGNSYSQGLYVEQTDGLTIEENVFDHNGWIDSVKGSEPSMFRHNVYVQNGCTGVVFRGNIVAGTDGAQIRPGGIVKDNLVARCIAGLHVGVGDSPEPSGVSVMMSKNVVIEGRNPAGNNSPVIGMRVSNLIGGSITDNLVVNALSYGDSHSLWFSPIGNTLRVAMNVTLSGNIFSDAGNVTFPGLAAQYGGNTIAHCVFQTPPNQWNDGIAAVQDHALLAPSYFAETNNHWSLSGFTRSRSHWYNGGYWSRASSSVNPHRSMT